MRHRLNRGGDRAINRAMRTIATVRRRDCPATQAYIARRTAEGKTSREIKLAVAGKTLIRIELEGTTIGEQERRYELVDRELFRELLR